MILLRSEVDDLLADLRREAPDEVMRRLAPRLEALAAIAAEHGAGSRVFLSAWFDAVNEVVDDLEREALERLEVLAVMGSA